MGDNLNLERCPYCSIANPLLKFISNWQVVTTDSLGNNNRFWKGFKCTSCGGIVIAQNDAVNNISVHEHFPAAKSVNDSIPERAGNYLSQALNSISSPDGAVMLCASAIDAMLKDKKYSDGSLYARIEDAAKDHLITDEMSEWAHDVRLDANDKRHADEDTINANRADAERCVEFALALAEFLYVLPARVQRGRDQDN